MKNRKKSTNNLLTSSDYTDISINSIPTNELDMNTSSNYEMPNNILDNLMLKNQNTSLYSSNSTANTSLTLNNNNNNLLNVSPGDQDQIRRCSHDPNIEKLHKTFFNNVKLGVSHAASSHISSSSSLSQPTESQLFRTPFQTSTKSNKKSILNGVKKLSIKNKNKTPAVSVKIETSSSENPSSTTMATKAEQSIDDTDSNDMKLELESTEKSDVLNEISKVNKWLRDNKNHHKKNNTNGSDKDNKAKKITKLPSITISEDEDNSGNAIIVSKLALNTSDNKKGINQEKNANEVKTKSSFETNDSAIDIRSYG